jgi:hypothetical protein
MSSYELCVSTPLPTFSSLQSAISSLIAQRPPGLSIPSLPTMPSPLYSGIYNPSIYLNMVCAQLQITQLLDLILAMFMPIAKILEASLDDLLPKIPGLNINLIDLLSGDASAFIKKLEGVAVSTLIGFAGLPASIYNHLISPAMSAVDSFQILIINYFAALVNTLTNLVNRVAKILSGGTLSIPTVPDMGTIFNDYILPLLPNIPQIPRPLYLPDLGRLLALLGIPNIPNFQALLALVHIPGFSFDSTFSVPFYVGLSMPEFEVVQMFKSFYANIITAPLQLILNFINSLHLSVLLPKICIPITTTVGFPMTPHIKLPGKP